MEHVMDDAQRDEFFELVGEMKTVAESLSIVPNDEKIWKIKLKFAMLRELVWQAEALVKGGTSVDF
jgi:hypothetical protein|tara:strand:- start:2137 stop:2334 length:198 start_codon:yes stop_codon:yes gene_type:complete